MGYKITNTKDIAKVVDPQVVSLSELPNFVEIKRIKDNITGNFVQIVLSVESTDLEIPTKLTQEEIDRYVESKTTITFKDENSATPHTIKGTTNPKNVNSATYFVKVADVNTTAENIKECLMQNSYLNSNFSIIKTVVVDQNNVATIDHRVQLQSLGQGINYKLQFYNEVGTAVQAGKMLNKIVMLKEHKATSNDDSIDGGSGNTSIELEVYTNTGSKLGENKYPENSLGTYMTTLGKAYRGQPLWFNLNALMANRNTFSANFLTATNWCEAGTMVDYRFIARRFDGVNREPFYLSDVLYNVTGFDRNLEAKDLNKYIYDAEKENIASPLTRQLDLTHIKGQTQYFNFIFKDANRKGKNDPMGIKFRLYTQSRQPISESESITFYKEHKINRSALKDINTVKLGIDGIIEKYEDKMISSKQTPRQVGFVEACLFHTVKKTSVENNVETTFDVDIESRPLTFRILPECLYSVNDFAFLNSLGGWSSFNFGGEQKTDFKSTTNTIFKTQTPQHNISSEIESVFNKDVKEVFAAETMPINEQTVNWLKEMSSSIAVYELSTHRYIIVDEMNIKPNSKDDLFRVEMKYRYSDSYNSRI